MIDRMLSAFTRALCVIVLAQPTMLYGQTTWQRTYGGYGMDEGHCVKQVMDGGYLVLGSTGSFGAGSSDFYLVRLDLDGALEWSAAIGTPGAEQGWGIAEAADGYALVGFSSGGTGGFDGMLVFTDHLGTEQWRRFYGGSDWDFLYAIAADPEGYFLVGNTYSGSGNGDQWLLKVQSNGDTLWTRSFGTEYEDVARGVASTADGGCIVAGTIGTEDGTTSAVLTKFSATGDQQWQAVVGGASNDAGMDVVPTIDGGYVLSGSTESFSAFREMLMAKVDHDGVLVWQQHVGQIADWEGRQIVERPDGGLALVGFTMAFGAGGKDVYLLFTDAEGEFMYGRTYGGSDDDEGWSVDLTLDGGVVITGSNASSGPGVKSMYVIKGDATGEVADPQDYPYFDPLPVTEQATSSGVLLTPTLLSPGDEMHVRLNGQGSAMVSILDLRGTVQAMVPLNASTRSSIRIPDLAPGPYLISIEREGLAPMVARFVVMW